MASRHVGHEPRSAQDAVRITTASPGRGAEIAARQRRYLLSMLVRTGCFLGAVAVGAGWLRWVLIVGAVVLPYVAVVMANAMPDRSADEPLPSASPGREIER